jgi:dimethylhistidine N-methyltransferase
MQLLATDRFVLHEDSRAARAATFGEDVRAGLGLKAKRLVPKYFYDDLGSALFEAICKLPEYYLTRAESEIFERYADEIVGSLDGPLELVELGSGSAVKTKLLIEALLRRQPRLEYHAIDISPDALVASARGLTEAHPELAVSAYAYDYVSLFDSTALTTRDRTMALFLGSNLGNYDPLPAAALLRSVARRLRSGDAILLGVDLKKSIEVLERAYDDPTGVTAAFNKNILGRINRELGGDFNLAAFEHEVHYDPMRGSVDSFLVAQSAQTVSIVALDLTVEFAAAEAIHTESSYKFSRGDIERVSHETGFKLAQTWTDSEQRFAVNLLVVR